MEEIKKKTCAKRNRSITSATLYKGGSSGGFGLCPCGGALQHHHSFSGTTGAANHLPPYLDTVFAQKEKMCGDVTGDGKVTMSDVRKVFNRYLDPNYPLDLPWAADVNCDGKVTMSDVRKVFNRYLDPGYELNCC